MIVNGILDGVLRIYVHKEHGDHVHVYPFQKHIRVLDHPDLSRDDFEIHTFVATGVCIKCRKLFITETGALKVVPQTGWGEPWEGEDDEEL